MALQINTYTIITTHENNDRNTQNEESVTAIKENTVHNKWSAGRAAPGTSVDDNTFLKKQKERVATLKTINKIQEANKESKNTVGYMGKIVIIITSTVWFTIMLTILMFIPLTKIIIGTIYFNKCPAEPLIPLYLVVGGIVACVRDSINLCLRGIFSDEGCADYEVSISAIACMYELAEFTWFIYGSIYVYRTYNNYQSIDSSKDNYCNTVLYMFALITTTISYILLMLVCLLMCTTVCLARCLDYNTENKLEQTEIGKDKNKQVALVIVS